MSIFKILCLRSGSGEEIQQNFGRRRMEKLCGFLRRDGTQPRLFRRAVSAVGRRISTSSSPVLMGFQTAMQAPTSFVLYTHIFVQAFKSEAEEILENCKCMIYFLCIHTMAFIAWPKGY